MDDPGHKYYKTPGRQDASVLKKVRGGGSLKHPAPRRQSSEGINPPSKSMAASACGFLHIAALSALRVCVCFRPQFESISAIWGGSGCQRASCCTGSCSGPPRCNGRYLLLTCSSHTITERCGGNLCLYLRSLLSLLSASELQCLFCRPHTHNVTHTHTLLSSSSQFLIFEREWVQECRLLAWLLVSISVHRSGLASPPPFIQI